VAAIFALSGTACSTMQVQHAPTPVVVSDREGRTVRVKLTSGEKVELFDATLRGDSIVGYTAPRSSAQRQTRSVATADVREIAVRKFSPVMTVLAVGAVVAAVAILTSGSSSSPQSSTTNTGCQSAQIAPAA
jgi:hypothetical protein